MTAWGLLGLLVGEHCICLLPWLGPGRCREGEGQHGAVQSDVSFEDGRTDTLCPSGVSPAGTKALITSETLNPLRKTSEAVREEFCAE